MGEIWSDDYESGASYGKIILESDGWSGKVLDATEEDLEERKFQFEINMDGYSYSSVSDYHQLVQTTENNYGYCRKLNENNPVIVGISLEHMGKIVKPNLEGMVQFIGITQDAGYVEDTVGAWGAITTDNVPTLKCINGNINVHEYEWQGETGETGLANDVNLWDIGAQGNFFALRLFCLDGGNWPRYCETTIKTDLPIFETDADLMEYVNSGGTVIDKMLNIADPEEEYEEQFAFHYVNNIFGHNTRNATAYSGFRNYRFFPASKRMCFYRVKPTASSPYTVRLMGYDSSVVVKSAPAYGSSDDDYETISGAPELYYLHKSISFANNDYYTKFKFSTDLLVYGNQSDAQDYINGVGDPRLAENFNDVSRQYNEYVDPKYGNPDAGNDHGKNGINYSRGSTLWMLTETEMHTFYGDIFNTANISDILSNTQLFGANQINSILGVAYYPFDVADVCRLDSSKKIYVGSWECPNATGKRVLFNYDLIDCGSISIPRVYNDYRDYEMEIYISLPYVGVHKLNTALYMGASSLHIYYAVDVSTGCCTAHLHVTNETLTDCEIDSWDGFISSMRPISAIDQQAYISGVMGNVTSIFNRETGMVNDAAQAIGGVMSGNVKGALSSGVGPGYGFSQSAGAIGDLYGLSQSVRDVPITTRGGFSGALGMFGNQKIHIITAQKRKTVPDNKLLTVGLPSNIGGRVGLFSGFLSVSAFTMADGFTGTAEELREIESIMANGIFL